MINATSADGYALIGGDALIQSTGEAKLIELNHFPAMFAESAEFNNQIAQPVIRDLIMKILFGTADTGFHEVGHARRRPLRPKDHGFLSSPAAYEPLHYPCYEQCPWPHQAEWITN